MCVCVCVREREREREREKKGKSMYHIHKGVQKVELDGHKVGIFMFDQQVMDFIFGYW